MNTKNTHNLICELKNRFFFLKKNEYCTGLIQYDLSAGFCATTLLRTVADVPTSYYHSRCTMNVQTMRF